MASSSNHLRAAGAVIQFGVLSLAASVLITGPVRAQTLRIAAYNICADSSSCPGGGSPNGGTGLTDVLKAIGQEHLAGNAQPLDVLALEELDASRTPGSTYPSDTLDYLVGQMNHDCPTCNYVADTTVDPTTGGTGGGPSGLIYNTNTVQEIGTGVVVGSDSGSGAPRAPMRYKLAPKGYNNHTADFFLYVSHMKSGTSTTPPSDADRRNVEANTIRTNSASAAVGSNAHVIYAGDFNVTDSSEAAYQTMISPSLPGIGSVGQAIDTLNPANNWNTNTPYTFRALFTEKATNVEFRDDFQFVTSPMLNQPGMQLVANSLVAFGNGGSIAHTSVTSGSNSAALADLPNRTTILADLTTATDHLPIVADYSFASAIIPGDYDHNGLVDSTDFNIWQAAFGSTTSLDADGNHDGVVDAADYTVWRDNLGHSLSGSGAGSTAAVPEPASWVLLLVGISLARLSKITSFGQSIER
jgi:hypothetical protein